MHFDSVIKKKKIPFFVEILVYCKRPKVDIDILCLN